MGEDQQRKKSGLAPRGNPWGKQGKPEPTPEELSAEEQMAKFEEALKDEDWGHQPC